MHLWPPNFVGGVSMRHTTNKLWCTAKSLITMARRPVCEMCKQRPSLVSKVDNMVA